MGFMASMIRLLLGVLVFRRFLTARFTAADRSARVTVRLAVGHPDLGGSGHFWVWIFDPRKVADAGLGVEILQHDVSAVFLAKLRDGVAGIVDVSENQRVAGTRLLTGGLELPDRNSFLFRAPASTSRAIFASSILCMQNVHFSMTPRIRTVTFGFFDILRLSATPFGASGPA
jgi:hypothetical protein